MSMTPMTGTVTPIGSVPRPRPAEADGEDAEPLPARIDRVDFLETLVLQERLDAARARVAEAEAHLEVARMRSDRLEREHVIRIRELGVKYRMPEGTTVLEDGRIVRA